MTGGARWAIGGCAAMLAMAPVAARDTLGVYRGWAAFRDPERCYAIAQPQGRVRSGQPFAAVATWPAKSLRASLHVRLSHPVQPDQPVTLSVGERRFRLTATGADAFAADAASDRAIVAALRDGRSMSVEAVGQGGHPFADSYALAGAATAIDAATLACAALR
ncbi:invasion associated locus B family protein [Sphingomonas sp. KR1UV-12]|uniref:Invasion associated locus B family protein n=1 Tax=Sphingomonas aurea TaxID=3063994 RepID=A0ABT9EJP2_9SPHN|nr:invasion associated locus B family protein [Sphingomonas sp. KR1UV-12]MDP1027190.1 invasion associated locus B family protein [Sphingomonas sp. KR1UV-12]